MYTHVCIDVDVYIDINVYIYVYPNNAALLLAASGQDLQPNPKHNDNYNNNFSCLWLLEKLSTPNTPTTSTPKLTIASFGICLKDFCSPTTIILIAPVAVTVITITFVKPV